jgi:vacuole morphology and inheritance protein 14
LSTEPDTTKAITSSASTSNVGSLRIKPPSTVPTSEPVTPIQFEFPASVRPTSPNVQTATPRSTVAETVSDDDAFDVRETVNVLTLQFLSDHAETRIAALEWLLMLPLARQ